MAPAGKSGLSMPAFDPETVKGREGTGYPEPYRSSVGRRIKRALGEAAGYAPAVEPLGLLPLRPDDEGRRGGRRPAAARRRPRTAAAGGGGGSS